jgi:type VI secretion system secreted protein VgrG
VDVQAQGGPLSLSSARLLSLNSNHQVTVAGHNCIELAAGGHGIRISAKGIEVFGDIKLHGTLSNEGKAGLPNPISAFPKTELSLDQNYSE